MKLLNVLMLAVILPLAPAFAADAVTHPCKDLEASLVTQCTAAGFPKGKGLYNKCIGVIKKGGTVTGVTPDASLTAACEAKKEKKAAKAAKAAASAPTTK